MATEPSWVLVQINTINSTGLPQTNIYLENRRKYPISIATINYLEINKHAKLIIKKDEGTYYSLIIPKVYIKQKKKKECSN